MLSPRQPTASQSPMSEGRIERYKSDELVSQIASSGSLICNIQESETSDGLAFIFMPYGVRMRAAFDGEHHTTIAITNA
jgi:hypothetical protein